MSVLPNVKQLSDVLNTQPAPPENWRELMLDYINKLEPLNDFHANDRQYSKAKIELMKFVPLSYYHEVQELLIDKIWG